jgi:hypothetical protein
MKILPHPQSQQPPTTIDELNDVVFLKSARNTCDELNGQPEGLCAGGKMATQWKIQFFSRPLKRPIWRRREERKGRGQKAKAKNSKKKSQEEKFSEKQGKNISGKSAKEIALREIPREMTMARPTRKCQE